MCGVRGDCFSNHRVGVVMIEVNTKVFTDGLLFAFAYFFFRCFVRLLLLLCISFFVAVCIAFSFALCVFLRFFSFLFYRKFSVDVTGIFC